MDGEQESLVDRAVRRLKVRSGEPAPQPVQSAWRGIEWRIAAAIAVLIALGPLLTIMTARLLEHQAGAEAAALRAKAAPRTDAIAADRMARDLLRAVVREAPVAVWLDRAATVLPDDARIARMARAADGRLEIDIMAPDPDQVRGAMRRDAVFAGFRETGQRRAGAMILVTYRRAA